MDSRFPTYYLNDRRVLKAPPQALRLFVFGTAWSVSNMTDGHIGQDDLYLIPFANEDDAEALVTSGLWNKTDNGYRVADYAKTQTSAASMEASYLNRKTADAERQRKKYERDKAKAEAPTDPTDPVPTSREDHVRLEGKAEAEERQRQRQGKASDDKEVPKDEQQLPVTTSSEVGPDGWPMNLSTTSVGGGTNGLSSEALNRWKRSA